jgi:Predicted hydrolases or acyltransferases (alpha/beta hydrolase superfamily)
MSRTPAPTNKSAGSASTPSPRDRMLAGLPVTTRTPDIDRTATSVLEGGDGPPLVLLHGGIECGGVMWAPAPAQLAVQLRVVVPDVPGLGESVPVPRLDVDTFTGWFTGLLDQTNLSRAGVSPFRSVPHIDREPSVGKLPVLSFDRR